MNPDDDILGRQARLALLPGQIDELRPFGEVRPVRAGDVVYEAGAMRYPLVAVLEGRVAVVDRSEGNATVLRTSGPGEVVGELSVLTGEASFATCVVRAPGALLVVPFAGVLAAMASMPDLNDALVTAFAARRQLLMRGAGASLTLVGQPGSPALGRLEVFTDRNRIPYRSLAPDDPAAVELVRRLRPGRAATDASDAEVWVVVRGERILRDPGILELAKAIGLDLVVRQEAPADLIVVGAGPAGLSAAVYGASEGLDTLVVEDLAIGGQAGSSSLIENYLGFPTGIPGGDLAFRAEVQAVKFGARITVPRQATSLEVEPDGLLAVRLDDRTTVRGRTVVVATGARYRKLDLEREAGFAGEAVHYAATDLEARRCRGRPAIVVGSGNSAGQAAMFLSRLASEVHVVCRGPDLASSMSHYLVTRLEHAPNVRIRTGSQVTALHGDDRLASVTVTGPEGEERLAACAVFVLIGAEPCTDWLPPSVQLDPQGYILTGHDLGVAGGRLEPEHDTASHFATSLPGVFAVGDVRSGSSKRVASAVGEGAVVVQAIHRALAAGPGGAVPR